MKNLFLLLGLILSLDLFAKELVIISDLDETLRIADVEKKGAAFLKIVEGVRPYEALVKIFNEIKKENPDAKFYYLSNSFNVFYSGKRWTQKYGLPEGEVFQRRLFKDKSATFKPVNLRRIVVRHPDARFLMFGDNIERDPQFYRSLVTDMKLTDSQTFIRDARLIFPQENDVIHFQHELQIVDDLDISASVSTEIAELPFKKLVPKFLFDNLKSRLVKSCQESIKICRAKASEQVRQVREELEHETYASP